MNLGSRKAWVLRVFPDEIQRVIAAYAKRPDRTRGSPTAALIGDCAAFYTPDALIFGTPDHVFLISEDDFRHVTQPVRRYWMRHRRMLYHLCERCDPLSDDSCI